ncbi:MAG: hypothetical protein II215_04055 [Paludibacteraceae bacterium]|jgi:flagellar capping protein FliD|nr:hypothetical protein [Paludibacteraceae bacterium]MED9995869.1 hypothetical protein [Paludibacteraceae bacterium]
MSLTLPLSIAGGKLHRNTNVTASINAHIDLILTTHQGECTADPGFGFVFNNLRFEMFNENEGVVFNSASQKSTTLYNKKIAGTSKSIHTFATELKQQIERYESRLSEVSVAMSYMREQRRVLVTIKGVITETKEPYQYKQNIVVWS